MKTWLLFSVVALLAACSPPVERAEVLPPSSPTPAPTPHPALAAQKQALLMYPELGKKGSLFNTAFVEIYNQDIKAYPDIFRKPEWPIYVANRTGKMLNVHPVDLSPTPVPLATPKPAREPTALERGAYDSRRAMRVRSTPAGSVPYR